MRVRALLLAGLLLLLSSVAFAEEEQDPDLRVEARVSAALTDGFFIDVGSAAGLEPGDVGYAYPAGQARVQFVIRSVSKTVARADPNLPGAQVSVGTRVELVIPAERLQAAEGTAAELPWAAASEDWDTTLPLLAPAGSIPPEEREQRLFGRIYTGFDATFDREGEERDYVLGRLGTDLRMENPFGRGGTLELDAEVWHRATTLGGSSDEELTELRVNRLSYRMGGTRYRPEGVQVGRFLQSGFSEFGVIDGAEYTHRTDEGNVFGGSLGMLLTNDAEFSSGDDVQAALFFRHLAQDPTAAEWGVGYQKTWHTGHPDRDLIVGDARWNPTDRWSLYTSIWVDYYSDGDQTKSGGAELTDLRANANYRISSDAGLNFNVSSTRYPELERQEFTLTPDLADDQVSRAGLGAWKNLTDEVRLSGRFDRWSDDDDDGGSGELRVGWRNGLYDSGEVSLTVFNSEGTFSSLVGMRLQANRMIEHGFINFTWEAAEHTQDDFFGDQEDLLQQALRAAWDTDIGAWDLSLYGEDRFGDEQDSYSLGFYLQRRF